MSSKRQWLGRLFHTETLRGWGRDITIPDFAGSPKNTLIMSENTSENTSDESSSGSPRSLPDPVVSFLDAAKSIGLYYEGDVIVYSASVRASNVVSMIENIQERIEDPTPSTVVIALATEGGNPHAAFMLARALNRVYENIILLLFGRCKSAGTLIALSADRINMGLLGQLGPLDMQTLKEDEMLLRSSVLDIQQSLESINGYAFNFYRHFLGRIIETSGGTITTKTASEIASDMATDLLEPITSQIDPLRIGEDMRSMLVAEEYGQRLAPNREDAITDLTEDFPSHSFVIDFEIAQDIFGEDTVFEINDVERSFEKASKKFVDLRQESTSPFYSYVYYHDSQKDTQSHGSDQKHQGEESREERQEGGSDIRENPEADQPSGGGQSHRDHRADGEKHEGEGGDQNGDSQTEEEVEDD